MGLSFTVLVLIILATTLRGNNQCPSNTYKYGSQCINCLSSMTDCKTCSGFGKCDECATGFYQG